MRCCVVEVVVPATINWVSVPLWSSVQLMSVSAVKPVQEIYGASGDGVFKIKHSGIQPLEHLTADRNTEFEINNTF